MARGFKLVTVLGIAILALLSAYCLLLLVLPFFLLGIHKIPMIVLAGGRVAYEGTFGSIVMVATIVLFARGIALYLSGAAWLATAARFSVTRERWVLALCLVAPIPIIYYYFGPYHAAMLEWLLFD